MTRRCASSPAPSTTDTICLFTNQLREKIGVMFGNRRRRRAAGPVLSVRLDIAGQTLKAASRRSGTASSVEEQGRAAVQAGGVRHIIYGSGIS
jgi:RecA/RadA recombinase